ncbi:MAG: M48 metallopeptidase family protein, partial [Burkholderiales bacterium]
MSRWRDKEDFKAHVRVWAKKLDVPVRALFVRPMRAQWASCSTAGNLNFNSELLTLDKRLGDYVIVHELLHFSVPNHGQALEKLDARPSRRIRDAGTEATRFARGETRRSATAPPPRRH